MEDDLKTTESDQEDVECFRLPWLYVGSNRLTCYDGIGTKRIRENRP
jgi:hypothetical protein